MPRRTSVVMLVALALIHSVLSVFLVYSASRRNFGYELAFKQSIWIVLGVLVAFVIARFPRSTLLRFDWLLYLGGLFLLFLTYLFGIEVRGDRSWLDLGLVHVQTSEFMKPVLILFLASIADGINKERIGLLTGLFYQLSIFLLPVSFILLQPDAGTALVYATFFVFWLVIQGLYREAVVLFLGGFTAILGIFSKISESFDIFPSVLNFIIDLLPYEYLFNWPVAGILLVIFGIFPYLSRRRINAIESIIVTGSTFIVGRLSVGFLESYQIERLKVFLDPYRAPLRSGYNIIQSQIAIGSGGWFGQGYLHGSQSQLGFIPELWTDFIFSVAIEEFGLLFGLVFVAFLTFMIYSVFSVATLSGDYRGYLFCSGIGAIWIVHIMINLGVCVGLLPVIGLPLPFTSYGGSFMLTNWIMIGLLISVSNHPRGHMTLKSPDSLMKSKG